MTDAERIAKQNADVRTERLELAAATARVNELRPLLGSRVELQEIKPRR